MKGTNLIDLGLTAYDEMFMTDGQRAAARKPIVDEIPITELHPFRDHPFQVRMDEEMERLKQSIVQSGVLVPALARKRREGGYELISGHRRMAACRELGLTTMPVIVQNLSDEEAIVTMVDANLQREHILPSEKAFAYKMKMDALSHQGTRTDLTSSQVATKSDTAAEIGRATGDSRDQVYRYIRLTNLVPELLKMVDESKIALTPAVELSYMTPDEQRALLEMMEYEGATPSLSQAQRLHRLSLEGRASEESILAVLTEVKSNQKEMIRVPVESVRKYFRTDTSIKQMSETIVKAVEFYSRHLQRQRAERDAR